MAERLFSGDDGEHGHGVDDEVSDVGLAVEDVDDGSDAEDGEQQAASGDEGGRDEKQNCSQQFDERDRKQESVGQVSFFGSAACAGIENQAGTFVNQDQTERPL